MFSKLLWHCGDAVPLIAYRTAIISCTQIFSVVAFFSEITNAATKELNIEQELKNVNDVWRVQSFEVAKFNKDGVDKGWVLRSTESVTFLVEEMTLNLQGMTSSRFVRAFLDEVNSWAFKLGLIGEVIDIWMQVT